MALCMLPTEILEKIFSYLDTANILRLRQVHPRFADTATSRLVISKVKLFNHYDLTRDELIDFFGQSPTCNNITSFNITSVYWISAADLRKCIGNMTSLERLYVMDTKLGLIKPDVQLYKKLPKLKRLGVTILRKTLSKEAIQNFPALTHLHLHIHTSVSKLLQILIHTLCKNDVIEELSIVEIGLPTSFELLMLSMPRSITRLTTSTMHITCLRDSLEICNLTKTFMTNTSDQQCLYRQLSSTQKKGPLCDRGFSDMNWAFLLKLRRCSSPFSVEQSEQIYYDDSEINRMVFNEMNLIHPLSICSETYLFHIGKLLMYNSMAKVKKMGLNLCVCTSDKDIMYMTKTQPFKRSRREGEAPSGDFILSNVADNSPDVEELELWPCRRIVNVVTLTDATLECIGKFKKLRRLVVDGFSTGVSGQFFIKVFSECTSLTMLHVRSHQQNVRFHNMFCKALAYANLEDLRYEHSCCVSIDNLFLALAGNSQMKLKRLFIKCLRVEMFSVKPFKQFLEANPQLIFLCIVITELPQTVIKIIKQTLEKYSTDPRKIFLITKREDTYESTVNVPHVHLHQMIKTACKVSVMDVFNFFDE